MPMRSSSHGNARRILTEKRDDFIRLAEALLEYETLSGDEIKDLIAGKPPVRDAEPDKGQTRHSAVPTAGKGRRPANDDGLEPQPQA